MMKREIAKRNAETLNLIIAELEEMKNSRPYDFDIAILTICDVLGIAFHGAIRE
jgi:hypothetical protein